MELLIERVYAFPILDFYTLIYLWQWWVFLVTRGLSPLAAQGLLTAVLLFLQSTGSRECGLQYRGTQA